MHLPSACRFFVDEYLLEFWWKIFNFCVFFDAFTVGVSTFSCQKRRQIHFGNLKMRFRNLSDRKNYQNERKYIFYFSSLRGRGKSSSIVSEVKLTHFLIDLFFIFRKFHPDKFRIRIRINFDFTMAIARISRHHTSEKVRSHVFENVPKRCLAATSKQIRISPLFASGLFRISLRWLPRFLRISHPDVFQQSDQSPWV